MTLGSIIAGWAVLWLLVAAVITVAGLSRGRPLPTAAWLVTIGAFLERRSGSRQAASW